MVWQLELCTYNGIATLLLNSDSLEEGALMVYWHAYADCLYLLCLSFNSGFQLDLTINH